MRSRRSLRSPLSALILFPIALLVPACGSSGSRTDSSTGALFVIRVCRGSENAPEGESFRALIRDPGVVLEAENFIGAGPVRIIIGPLVRGDGGFNDPWSWHLDADRIEFAEGAIELCDGCPRFIKAELDYWIETVGTYCPWSTEVISRAPW